MKENDDTQTWKSDLSETLNKSGGQIESLNDSQEEKEEERSISSNNTSFDEGETTKLKEKEVLIKFLDDVKTNLDSEKNEKKTFDKIYEDYLETEFLTKSHVKEEIKKPFLISMIFIYGPFFGIIFLIGVFQIKSIMNALFNLITESCIKFYYCTFNSNCDVNYSIKELNVFDFYNYYYNYTMNESIEVNLMLITGFIGNLLLSCTNFWFSMVIFGLINIGAIFWLLNFEFTIGNEFDYDWVKILNLIIIYILFCIGLGSSALLAQQILIENYFKYKKDYLMKNINKKIREYENRKKQLEKKKELDAFPQMSAGVKNTKKDFDLSVIDRSYTDDSVGILVIKIDILKKKKIKIDKNKFDFFIMICLTTTFGYLGKYLMNLIIDFILFHIFGDDYDKRIFLQAIMVLYGVCIIMSIILYYIFEKSTFRLDEKKEEKKQNIKICQICGFILYCETQKLEEPEKKNCCFLNKLGKNEVAITDSLQPNKGENKENPKTEKNCCYSCCCYSCCVYTKGCCILFCESIQNCCYETFGYLLSILFSICYHCDSQSRNICKSCKYNEQDYNKNKECFCYCYKARRKSLWCNKFFTNKTVRNIFPFMIVYFILQLTTIGFEKQYEKYKYEKFHIKTFIFGSLGTFALFFYLTLSFSRLFRKEKNEDNPTDNNKKNSNNEPNDSLNKKKSGNIIQHNFKDKLSELSNDILNGTIGILFFNSLFSFIFSLFYFVDIPEESKSLFFKDNTNIILIPVLMNNFYYLTLNYYCTYTAEKTKKFEILSCSSLISFYILIWRLVITLIKAIIPEENENNSYINFQILYIIQIIISGIIILFAGCFILSGIIMSMGFFPECSCCFFKKGKSYCTDFFHCIFFCCSFILCLGGLWLQMMDFRHYKYICCSWDNYCNIGVNCCDCNGKEDNEKGCHCCFCKKKKNEENVNMFLMSNL